MTKREKGLLLSKDDIVVVLDYFNHQYVHYDNILLIELLRRFDNELKELEREEAKETKNESKADRTASGARS